MVGVTDGGSAVGSLLGRVVGVMVGLTDSGGAVGLMLGNAVGADIGAADGNENGVLLGELDGVPLGLETG